jgi:hypothetical protein
VGSSLAQVAIPCVCEAYSAIDYRMAKLKFKAICTPLQGIRIRIPVANTRAVYRKRIEEIDALLLNLEHEDSGQ